MKESFEQIEIEVVLLNQTDVITGSWNHGQGGTES